MAFTICIFKRVMMTELINLHYPIKQNIEPMPQVVAMGFFDGIHLGHQAVLQQAKSEADALGIPSAILTYAPHPAVVFQKFDQPMQYLTPLSEKLRLLQEIGIDYMYVMNFTSQLARVKPQAFVDDVLMRLNPVTVVAGFDHLYGPKNSQADMQHLSSYAQNRFNTIVVNKVDHDTEKVGSRQIRHLLNNGHVDEANQQLGRIYETAGLVVHGEARGRELGFPTANIETTIQQLVPGIGIYAVEILVAGYWRYGMASIGRNVTFGAKRPITIEINILDFNEEIYGEFVRVRWHHYLRGEVKFDNVETLIQQLQQDEIVTRTYFKKIKQEMA